jgi:hypothetical protein
MKRDLSDPNSYRFYDLCVSNRISLLLEWFVVTGEERFASLALSLAENPVGGFSPWSDGANLVRLLCNLQNGSEEGIPCALELSSRLESSIIDIFDKVIWADDLETMCNAIDGARDVLSADIF